MTKKSRIVIIGAGPAGLGVGWRLHEKGYDNFVLYEKQSYVGGLATSFVDPQGFTWDIGGHVLHSHYPYFDGVFEEVMNGEYYTHQRESWVWIYDRFVPYPFQNNIHRLPTDVMNECLEGLRVAAKNTSRQPSHFADWIVQSFGEGMAKHFMLPYNRKVWAYPLEKMSYQWVSDRVAMVDIFRIEQNIQNNSDDVSWGPNAVFHYPKHGGTGEIWKRVADRFLAHISFRKEVTTIDAKKKLVYFSDGSKDSYDYLFTTMPLDMLTKRVTGVVIPNSHAGALHHSHVTIIGLGIQGTVPDVLKTKCWMYFPNPRIPFFRATVLSNYSSNNAPAGTWSCMVEISSSPTHPLPKEDLLEYTEKHLRDIGLIPNTSVIVSRWSINADYGYPTPTMFRDSYVDPTLMALEEVCIYSRGRFGMWKYEVSNQDHTFMQGKDWADEIMAEK